MLTEWDPGKTRLNSRKHSVSFGDALASLEDDGALTMRDPYSDSVEEERLGDDGVCTPWHGSSWSFNTWRGESLRLNFGMEGDGGRTSSVRGSK
jgi:uncharacterized DUF497 family protein